MKQLVIVTFVLEGEKPENPEILREAFSKIELFSAISGTDNRVFELDDNTFAGTFDAKDTTSLADELLDKCRAVFIETGLKGRVLVSAGENWVWRAIVVRDHDND